MKALEVYQGSNGDATKAYYADLQKRGVIGIVAMNLFRAQKCSSRAKKYRGGVPGKGSYRGMAYDRKAYSMQELCKALVLHGATIGIPFGWKKDSKVSFRGSESWVLYVELPQGQVSFHSPERYTGPDYESDWDKQHASAERILAFCDQIHHGDTERPSMPEHFTKSTVEASFWCSKCGKPTMHRVDSGRRGPCLVCIAKLSEPKPELPPVAQQEDLF